MAYISSHLSGVPKYVLQTPIDNLITSFSFGHFQWFRLITENRPHEPDDNISGLRDINDIRNGVFTTKTIHPAFDGRNAAILKVGAKSITVSFV